MRVEQFPLIIQQDKVLVDARVLYQNLNAKTKFADWIRSRIVDYGFAEGQDYFSEKTEKLKAGRKSINYHLTLDMAKELAMLERNETGRNIRRYFIQKEKEVRGIPQKTLPSVSGLFKGLKAKKINSFTMYRFVEMRMRCGYSTKSSSNNYKLRYPGHFVLMEGDLYCTEELALHLWHNKAVINNRAILKATQPVLPFEERRLLS